MPVKYLNKKQAFISIFAIFFSAIIVSVLTALYILLVKQLEIMSIDAASFQSMYMADSAFECALYKETTLTGTNSVFQPANSGNLGYCAYVGDAVWKSSPTVSVGRSYSVLNINMTTDQGDFCGVVTVGKQVDNSEISNTMSISGQNRNCTDPVSKVIERLIDFYY